MTEPRPKATADAMTEPETNSLRRVGSALRTLNRKYGEFDLLHDVWTLDSEGYERTLERFESGTVGGAGAWVRSESGDVLLVQECGEDGWSEPAGKHESDETLAETARREVAEETNVTCTLTGVELAQVIRTEHPGRSTIYRLIVTFSADYERGTPSPKDGEIDAVRWWDVPPNQFQYDALERLPIPASSVE